MTGGEASCGVRMERTRLGKPFPGECKAASPPGLALLATTPECLPPKAQHPLPKDPEAIEISRHCVVVEVALHNRPEPFAGLGHRIMHALAKLLLDFLQLLPHPLANRGAPHREVPFPVLPADVREPKKVERLRFAFPSSFPVLFGKPPELDQTRLVGMEFQPELSQSLPELLQESLRVRPMLES